MARTLAGGLELDERNDWALCGRRTSQVHVVYVDSVLDELFKLIFIMENVVCQCRNG